MTSLTVASWNHRLDDEGPGALVQVSEPVNRFPEFVGYLVRRMLKPKPKSPCRPTKTSTTRAVIAKHPNHVWHLDLTTVPTIGGFWISWLPFSLPQRWPFCWWVAVVVDHFSRRVMSTTRFNKEPTAKEITRWLGRVCRDIGRCPRHIITDHGVQFTAATFGIWCRRRGIQQRFGATGKYGSLAVIERFIRSMKNECTRLLPVVPLAQAAFGRALDYYAAWFNAERPHSRFGARTPDEMYSGKFPASRTPRFEPRSRWPRRSPCAAPHALVRGRPGANVELSVEHRGGRKHPPIVALRLVA